jgi:hypothetical protein
MLYLDFRCAEASEWLLLISRVFMFGLLAGVIQSAKLRSRVKDLDANADVYYNRCKNTYPDRCIIGVDAKRLPLISYPAP